MAAPEVRYCTTEDGVRIAYCVEGEGDNALILIDNHPYSNVDAPWAYRRSLAERLSKACSCIWFDGRGSGASERRVTDVSLSARVLDLSAVVRESRASSVVLVATATSGPTAIAWVAENLLHVSGLVLVNAYPDLRPRPDEPAGRGLSALASQDWDLLIKTLAHVIADWEQVDANVVASVLRDSVSSKVAGMYHIANQQINVTDLLGAVTCPALVLLPNRSGLTTGRRTEAQAVVRSMPNARFRAIQGIGVVQGADELADVIADFASECLGLPGTSPATKPPLALGLTPGGIRSVLFTDLVGHTEMMQRLGDERGRVVLREHERITREVLKQHAGEEIKTMGDGFMASFGSASNAVECAIALQKAFAAHNADVGVHGHAPLSVRVGLNAGEPIAEDGDLFGSTVILASRVCAQAGPGEILIPEPVRHLLTGKDFLFADRGEVTLKGFEDAYRLFEVRWQE